ncbi:MAG: DUF971 domain-containing protein [Candidatus Kapabacteria bacterium]|nr:DUF971 domain-containing protein [Candidatus Kapabacteria bacterium]MDW8012860.1 DUF971 domain-containing protein [Bacteroidota bacterium]
MARVLAVRRVRRDLLLWRWDDGVEVYLPIGVLREHCPCAFCRGEQVFDRRILPVPVVSPGMYELVGLEPVGNYGLRAKWRDGHDTGIYPWELLHQLCQTYGVREPPAESRSATEHADE